MSMKKLPTLAEAIAAYKNLEPEELRVIENRISTLTATEITALRTTGLEDLLSSVRLTLIDAAFEDLDKLTKQAKKDNQAALAVSWPAFKEIDAKLMQIALSWVHLNEFWLKVTNNV